jgi:hypothetical protein
MKICRIPALMIFLLVAITGMQAQVKPGYIFGLNLSSVNLKTAGLTSKPDTPVGIHFGGSLEIPVNSNFSMRPCLLFSAKGSTFKIDSVEITLSPIYIEIPVLAVYSFGSEMVRFSLYAGPYFAFGMGGYKIRTGNEIQNLSYGAGEKNDLKPFDAGLNFGAGININGFLVSAQYSIGLANISPASSSDSVMKNKVIGFSISSLFPGRKG